MQALGTLLFNFADTIYRILHITYPYVRVHIATSAELRPGLMQGGGGRARIEDSIFIDFIDFFVDREAKLILFT